jgi:hypothetical protein
VKLCISMEQRKALTRTHGDAVLMFRVNGKRLERVVLTSGSLSGESAFVVADPEAR